MATGDKLVNFDMAKALNDDFKANIIAVQSSQPTSDTNKLWIPDSAAQEIQVPTYDEFNGLKSAFDNIADEQKSTNLWNPETTVIGMLNTATGNVNTSQTDYVVSDFIEVSQNDSIYVALYEISTASVTIITPSVGNNAGLCVYDQNKTFIRGLAWDTLTNPYTISDGNAKYIRFNLARAHFENQNRIYGIFTSLVTSSTFERYYDPIYSINEQVGIPQIQGIAGVKPVPQYTLTNFSFGADTFDSMGVTGLSGHRYTVVYTRLVGAYAQVGIIASGAWKGSELGSNNIATFTATENGTFYFKKTSGNAQTIAEIQIFDTTDNDDLMAFLYTFKLDAEDLPYNGDIQKEYRSWYYGKKFAALGDSVTEQAMWVNSIRARFPFFSVTNRGIGGTHVGGDGANSFWQDARVNAIPTDTDFLTIMGGTNDCASSRTIGEVSRDNHDTSTFVGAYNVLISKLFYKFSASGNGYYQDVDYSNVTRVSTTKPIYILLMTCGFCGDTSYAGTNYSRMESFANACIDIGKLWGLPVADIYHNSGINPITYTQYLSDTIHPNSAGGRKIASAIIGAMLVNEPVE